MACLAFWARRRERSAGHGYIALAFLLVPGTALVLAVQRSPAAHLRYWGFIPVLVIGLTLLTVSLLRRRRMLMDEVARRAAAERSLADTNASLEAQVDARTRELRDVIDGLESFNRQISHDLRGPLGGIGGLAQLASEALQRGDLAAVQRLLPPIAQQAEVTARLVDALLMLARSGEVALNKVPLDLARLAQRGGAGSSAAGARGEQAPAVEIGELPVVEADETLLRAVMTNLIGNAIKFSAGRPDGKVRISADQQTRHGDGGGGRQRGGLRPERCGDAVPAVHPPARRTLRRRRHRLDHRAAHRRAPWRQGVGRRPTGRRRHLQFHAAGCALIARGSLARRAGHDVEAEQPALDRPVPQRHAARLSFSRMCVGSFMSGLRTQPVQPA